jgi:hypothetical protein
MVRGDLGGRDRQITEVGTHLRVAFVMIIEGSLHDDRLERRPQRRGSAPATPPASSSRRWRSA